MTFLRPRLCYVARFIPIIGFILLNLACTSAPEGLEFQEMSQGYLVTENNQPVLFYRTAAKSTQQGTHSRANYVHPLYDLDGEIITEDFPDDHLHHRGIFWAWHQVYIGDQLIRDMWDCTDFSWDFQDTQTNIKEDGSAEIRAKVQWKSSQWKNGSEPFAEENVTIRVYPTETKKRMIDFTIVINALEPGLRIGGSADEKGYGGFSTRIQLPSDMEMADSGGVVIPQNIAVTAGDWINFSGTFNKVKAGFAVLVHPDNPGHPRQWILRKKGSTQNVAYPGRVAVDIPVEKPLTLRYRLFLHKNLDMNAAYMEYIQAK